MKGETQEGKDLGCNALLGRLRLNAGDKTKAAMQKDGEAAADEIERLKKQLASKKHKASRPISIGIYEAGIGCLGAKGCDL